jgi:hypothetical protein
VIRPPTGKKNKDKNIKVTEEVHKELGQIDRLTEDYGNVVARFNKVLSRSWRLKVCIFNALCMKKGDSRITLL